MYDVIWTLVEKYGIGKIHYHMLGSAQQKTTPHFLYVSECSPNGRLRVFAYSQKNRHTRKLHCTFFKQKR